MAVSRFHSQDTINKKAVEQFLEMSRIGKEIDALIALLSIHFEDIFLSGALDRACQHIVSAEDRRTLLRNAMIFCPDHLIPKDSTPLSVKSLLHLVTEFNEIALAIHLINKRQHAVDAVFDDGIDTNTPLMLAVVLNVKEMVQLLLKLKANLRFTSRNKLYVFLVAVRAYRKNGNTDIIKLLLDSANEEETNLFFITLSSGSHISTESGLEFDIFPLWNECVKNITSTVSLTKSDVIGLNAIQYILLHKNHKVFLLLINRLKELDFFKTEKLTKPNTLFYSEKSFIFHSIFLSDFMQIKPLIVDYLQPISTISSPIRLMTINRILDSIYSLKPLVKINSIQIQERLVAIFEYYKQLFSFLEKNKDNVRKILNLVPKYLSPISLKFSNMSILERGIIKYIEDTLSVLHEQTTIHVTEFIKYCAINGVSKGKLENLFEKIDDRLKKITKIISIEYSDNQPSVDQSTFGKFFTYPSKNEAISSSLDSSPIRTACMREDVNTIINLLAKDDLPPEFDILMLCVEFHKNKSLVALLEYGFKKNLKYLFENVMNPFSLAIRASNEFAIDLLMDLAKTDHYHSLLLFVVQIRYGKNRLMMKSVKDTQEEKKYRFYDDMEKKLDRFGVNLSDMKIIAAVFTAFVKQAVDVHDVAVIKDFLIMEKNNIPRLLQDMSEGAWKNIKDTLQIPPSIFDEILLTIINLLSTEYVTSVGDQFSNGPSLAHIASYFGSEKLLDELTGRGGSVNLRVSSLQSTPLHSAVEDIRSFGVLKKLISMGADINSLNAKGQTPLNLSMLYKNSRAAVELLCHGADLNKRGENTVSPIRRALSLYASGECPEIAEKMARVIKTKYFSQDPHVVSSLEAEFFFSAVSMKCSANYLANLGFLPSREGNLFSNTFINDVISLIESVNNFPDDMKPFTLSFLEYCRILSSYSTSKTISGKKIDEIYSCLSDISKISVKTIQYESLSPVQVDYCLGTLRLFVLLLEEVKVALDKILLCSSTANLSTDSQIKLALTLSVGLTNLGSFSIDVPLDIMGVLINLNKRVHDSILAYSQGALAERKRALVCDELLAEAHVIPNKKGKKAKSKKHTQKINMAPKAESSHMPTVVPLETSENCLNLSADNMMYLSPMLKLVEKTLEVNPYLVGGSVLSLLDPEAFKTNDLDMVFASSDNDAKIADKVRQAGFHIVPQKSVTRFSLYQYRQDGMPSLDLARINTDDIEWLTADACGRDFSICCLYAQVTQKADGMWQATISDPTQRGMKDFKARILFMENPLLRFNEDPVRLLRAVKYHVRGLNFDPALLTAIQAWEPKPDIMTTYAVGHLWSVLKQIVDFSCKELTEQERLFLLSLKKLDLISRLFGIKDADIPEQDLKDKLALRLKMRSLVKSDGYVPVFGLFDAAPNVSPTPIWGTNTSDGMVIFDSHPLDFALGGFYTPRI